MAIHIYSKRSWNSTNEFKDNLVHLRTRQTKPKASYILWRLTFGSLWWSMDEIL